MRAARQLLQRKERERRRTFLADGPQAVREALRSPGRVGQLLITAAATRRHPDLVEAAEAGDVPVRAVTEQDARALSDTITPQGVVAVCHYLTTDLADVLAGRPQLVVCCAEVRDPGNAGTVIRCADAFGADAVIMTSGSVDVYNAKTVRASVGSLFHLPVVTGAALQPTLQDCRAAGLQLLAADGAGDTDLDELAVGGGLDRPTLWVLGNEAWGLPEESRAAVDRVVRVPIFGAAESLNLSTAAAVVLYATAPAQHRSAGGTSQWQTGWRPNAQPF